jgi:CRP/FNR family cyclic AMP-dependent transcriptional regulator
MNHPLKTHFEEITEPFTDEEFGYILGHYKEVKRKKHQLIVEPGELVHNDFWVIKGCLRSYFIDTDGKEHIIQFAMENWWITDYNAYVNKTASTIFIECIEDCELLSLTFGDHEKLCREFRKIEHFSRVKTKSGYVAQQKRILSLLSNSAKERYDQLTDQYPKLLQRVPKKMIASYLGVSRETLSRLSPDLV